MVNGVQLLINDNFLDVTPCTVAVDGMKRHIESSDDKPGVAVAEAMRQLPDNVRPALQLPSVIKAPCEIVKSSCCKKPAATKIVGGATDNWTVGDYWEPDR